MGTYVKGMEDRATNNLKIRRQRQEQSPYTVKMNQYQYAEKTKGKRNASQVEVVINTQFGKMKNQNFETKN